jgi:hypothetical protein
MNKKNLWASPHSPTSEQISEACGFVFLKDINPALQDRLENSPDNLDSLNELATELLVFCKENNYNLYQPAGNPSFQFVLGSTAMNYLDVNIFYAYSERVSQDITQPDGSIKKVSIFKHKKFICVK